MATIGVTYRLKDEKHFWATVGMSLLPMPVFDMSHENPENYRKIEIGILLDSREDTMLLGSYLAAQAKSPWSYETHFDSGHTITCRELQELGSGMSFMLFVDRASFLPDFDCNFFTDNNIRFLFMIPIYVSEQAFAENTSSIELLQKIEQSNVNMLSLDRIPVV